METSATIRISGSIKVMLYEWIPMGSSWICFLQKRFECGSMNHTHYVTALVDRMRNAATVDVDCEECTRVQVAAFKPRENVRLIADIRFSATHAHQQIERVGIVMPSSGLIRYGIKLADRSDTPPGYDLKELAGILADLNDDSSHLMDALLNGYQRWLLDVVYQNERRHRQRFAVVKADRLTDADGVPLDLRRDREQMDRQLRGVLGPFRWFGDPSDVRESWAAGDGGLFVLTSGPPSYEEIAAYAEVQCLRLFRQHFTERMAWSWENLSEQRTRVGTAGEREVVAIQTELSRLRSDHALMISVPPRIRDVGNGVAARCLAVVKREDRAAHLDGPTGGAARDVGCLCEAANEDAISLEALGAEIENIRHLAAALADEKTFHISRATSALALLSAIFLPLTLVTGIYGMNFQRNELERARVAAPLNMPELYWRYGYVGVLVIMAVFGTAMYVAFCRKGFVVPFWSGWFKGRRGGGRRTEEVGRRL